VRQLAQLQAESWPAQAVRVGRRVASERSAADVERALAAPGRPLDPPVRAQMEERFQRDFSHVRVHSGDAAARSARGLGAAAYTVGAQIVVGESFPGAASPAGARLLAHELAHVVQQGGVRAQPRGLAPQGGPCEDEADQTAARHRVRLGRVAPGTVQRSPLSDRVRAAAGTSPTLNSVLAALSGSDVQVHDPDLDQEINRLFGGRADDIALAQQVRHRELGRTSGWTGPRGRGSAQPRGIPVRYVPGRTSRRALVIAGVHGSEVQGIEVAQQLLRDLASAPNLPEMSAIVVPDLFPDDAAYRDREGPGAHPNRNFPDASKDLAASGGKDALGKVIRPENAMLMQLMERFSPERIISIHGTWDPSKAGVSYDTRAEAPAEDARARAWGINPDSDESNAPRGLVQARHQGLVHAADEKDNRLSLGAADLIEARTTHGRVKGPNRPGLMHPSVAGNFTGTSSTANDARWGGAMDQGVSLGGYAAKRGISIFTVEPPDNKTLSEYSGAAQDAREVEIKAYAEAVRTILLGA
jgi:Domain of unknown function (DUF4157)